MVKYKSVVCSTPLCGKTIRVRTTRKFKYIFCADCKKDYPHTVLRVQAIFSEPVTTLLPSLMETYHFNSLGLLADFLDIFQQDLKIWLVNYVGVNSWAEFKKKYQCKSTKCGVFDCSHVPNFHRYGAVNKYYLVARIKKFGVCSCLYTDFLKYKPKSSELKHYIVIKLSDLEKVTDIQKLFF